MNRAAWTIGNLNALTTVPRLIPALFTTQQRVVWTSGSSGGGNFNVGFGSAMPTASMAGSPIAYNGSSYAYLTPPVVGNGVVAYGATAVPLLNAPRIGLATGGGSSSRSPTPALFPLPTRTSKS